MTLQRVEVGLVSADQTLVDFYAAVFQMERLPPMESEPGVVHRLGAPGVVIKVMVPSQRPAATVPPQVFIGATGIRYLTMYVDDLAGVLERSAAGGGLLQYGPMEIGPGARIAVLQDPDGNAIEVVEESP